MALRCFLSAAGLRRPFFRNPARGGAKKQAKKSPRVYLKQKNVKMSSLLNLNTLCNVKLFKILIESLICNNIALTYDLISEPLSCAYVVLITIC